MRNHNSILPAIIFLIVVFTTFLISCHKPCIHKQYTLNKGVISVSPDKDSIHVGDTLWFNSLIPFNLKYSLGNNSDSGNYNLQGATDIITDFHLTVPTGVGMQVGAIDSFSFIVVKGNLQPNSLIPHAGKTITYFGNNNEYIFSIGLVAQKKGIYILSTIDVEQVKKKCDKLSITLSTNNLDNHLHYLKDIYYGGGPINQLDSTHSYCFKVY